MIMVEFKKLHFVHTFWALKRVIPERQKEKRARRIEIQQDFMFKRWYGFKEGLVRGAISCIKAIIPSCFKVLFRDMLN